MKRSQIIVVENKEVCFQLEYYLLKSGKESCGIELVKTKDGEILETKTGFLDGRDADDVYRWMTRLAEAFVTPAVLEEMLREVMLQDFVTGGPFRTFPLFS